MGNSSIPTIGANTWAAYDGTQLELIVGLRYVIDYSDIGEGSPIKELRLTGMQKGSGYNTYREPFPYFNQSLKTQKEINN